MKKLVILILMVSFLCGCSNNISEVDNGIKTIDTATVFSNINDKNVYIIDVREEYEYSEGHIKNAYNVPLAKLNEINEMDISLDSKIIVYCQSGNRSGMAAKQLIEMGYTNVYDMGGITSWNYELVKE